MPVVESRVKSGLLTLDGEDFSCQPTAVSITPENEGGETESIEVLCGATLVSTEPTTLSATLNATSIQDFDAASGSFVGFTWTHNGQDVPFVWQATADPTDAWSGTCVIAAVEVGGEVNTRLDTDAEFSITSLKMPDKLGGAWVIGGPIAITGVTEGAPGSFQPPGAELPADLAGLKADPAVGDAVYAGAAWAFGSYVVLGDASNAYWDGLAWAVGMAP